MLSNNYKQILLRYLTGKLNVQTGTNEPIFNQDSTPLNKNIKNDISTQISTLKQGTNVTILAKIYSNQYDNFIVYGNYAVGSNKYGYIYIVDKDLNGVALLTEFDSGTPIYPIVSLRQSETGQFYGLTEGTNGLDSDYRVVLFNNILSSGAVNGTYQVILRNDYIVPDTSTYRTSLYRQERITKSLDSSIYYLVFHKSDGTATYIVKLTISVGGENEWEVFTIPYMIDTNMFDTLLDKSSGNEIFYIYGIDSSSSPCMYRSYQITDVISGISSISLGNNITDFTSQAFSVNKDSIYISACNSSTHQTTLYKVNGDSLTQIYQFNWSSSTQGYLHLELINGILFCKKNDTTSTSTITSVGILQNDTMFMHQVNTVNEVQAGSYDANNLYILSQYNLITIFVPNGDEKTDRILLDYNINNFNGNSYEDVNSLMPHKSRIFGTDGKMIFARNLYNKYVNGNITVSTVEIPTTVLNDKQLMATTLLGETNITFETDALDTTKNIYETVDINFYNKITMTDNNTSTTKVNKFGARRINNSITNLLDYQNAQATKARVNFSDGTSSITSIDPDTQITLTQVGNNYATYDFIIYVPSGKTVSNVEIISYDEQTSYATITGTFYSGKFNEIVQEVYVEEGSV